MNTVLWSIGLTIDEACTSPPTGKITNTRKGPAIVYELSQRQKCAGTTWINLQHMSVTFFLNALMIFSLIYHSHKWANVH